MTKFQEDLLVLWYHLPVSLKVGQFLNSIHCTKTILLLLVA
jgi:hypothetical protein